APAAPERYRRDVEGAVRLAIEPLAFGEQIDHVARHDAARRDEECPALTMRATRCGGASSTRRTPPRPSADLKSVAPNRGDPSPLSSRTRPQARLTPHPQSTPFAMMRPRAPGARRWELNE